MADKVIDALDSVENQLGLEDPSTPSLSSVLREARDDHNKDDTATAQQSADTPPTSPSNTITEARSPAPSLSQLLREAAEQQSTASKGPTLTELLREAAQRKEQGASGGLFDVVGSALESAISAPGKEKRVFTPGLPV